MKYTYEHSEKFETTFLPLLINFMKLLIDISCEIVEIITTFSLNDELWIIMCYTCMLCIS